MRIEEELKKVVKVMKILHYALGFPPYRTGGLTKYCMDLMEDQVKDGYDVSLLWPGQMKLINHKCSIKKRVNINRIHNYEIINPLPVSLDEGIKDVDRFTRSIDEQVYVDFFKKLNPSVIHIHTLMGLHKEFVIAANQLGIKTIFTTHDYFGLCPKVTLYKNSVTCDNDHNCKDCIKCNQGALTFNKIFLMQSPPYRKLKNSYIVKYLRLKHREKFFFEDTVNIKEEHLSVNISEEKYIELREFYINILGKIDLIHFNSSLSEQIYKRYFKPKNSVVLNISHRNIVDKRKLKEFNSRKLRISYLAPPKPFKGYSILKQTLNKLWQNGKKEFELHLFYPISDIEPYMKIKSEGYNYNELEKIFDETDLVIVPSVWYETFGFTTLEALSFGVPVIVTENVGAKDIIGEAGIVVETGSTEKLLKVIEDFIENREKLIFKNKETFNCKLPQMKDIMTVIVGGES